MTAIIVASMPFALCVVAARAVVGRHRRPLHSPSQVFVKRGGVGAGGPGVRVLAASEIAEACRRAAEIDHQLSTLLADRADRFAHLAALSGQGTDNALR